VAAVRAMVDVVRAGTAEWRALRFSELRFWHSDVATVTLLVLVGVVLTLLVLRSITTRKPGRDRITLPAVFAGIARPPWSFIRHTTLLLFLLGLPFFVLALADPYTSFVRENVSFPGRRIAILVDASSSMYAPFRAKTLEVRAPLQTAFFASVAAADYFVKLRMNGKYHDLIGLIEFGNEAYVVTPFTSDYENILLSMSLIGDPTEWGNFPDRGTVIGQALEQSVALFRAFDFLNAAGNLIVIFSDGEDWQVTVHGRHVDEILAEAVETKIPVYMIRTSQGRELGGIKPDEIWKPAVEKTGGKYYAAADESTILRAVREIDQVSTGRVAINRYGNQEPKFDPFALVAVVLWSLALTLYLTVPIFRKFP
jgi:Ca-activated chloride channel homolog